MKELFLLVVLVVALLVPMTRATARCYNPAAYASRFDEQLRQEQSLTEKTAYTGVFDPAEKVQIGLLRWYDPNLQRFINRDPIGENGGINLYSYVGNSPLNFVDPYGLSWTDYIPGWVGGFGGGYSGPTYSPPLAVPDPNSFGALHGIDNDFNGLTGAGVLKKALGDSADAVVNLAMMLPLGPEEAAGKVVCNWKSVKQFGHTFNEHGAKRALQSLIGQRQLFLSSATIKTFHWCRVKIIGQSVGSATR